MVKILSTIAVRFLSVLIMTFWVGTALADKRVALIVGNSQYSRISPKLINPANDAHDIAQVLESIGFKVILRTDVGKGEFDRSLAEFAREATGADTALFYYAGHGLQYQRQNFFLPVDIEVQDSADVEFQAVGMDRVLGATNRAAGVKIVILDACRDNPLAKQFTSRGINSAGIARGLARIDRTEGLIIAYATAPDQVAQDGSGRNSPFTEALIRRIKEQGLEIGSMFRRVTSDVYEKTNGRQRPEVSISLLNDYFLNPSESDSIAWSRIRDSNDPAVFKDFILKFPASPFAREAQFRIDLFERIRRETEESAKRERERIAREADQKRREEEARKEAERVALEAEQKRRAEEARKETERLALEAEQKRRAEEARKEAERAALEAEQKRRAEEAQKEAERAALEAEQKRRAEEARKEAERIALLKDEAARAEAEKAAAQRKEAERIQAEKHAAEERARLAALEEENRKRQEAEQEKQRIAGLCATDLARLKDMTAALQTAAIENLGKETACPTLKTAVDTALNKVTRGLKQLCDRDRKTLASLKDDDIEAIKTAAAHLSCETVRAEAQQHIAKLEDAQHHQQAVCADEKTKLNAIDASMAGARQQYVEFSAHAACPSLKAEIDGTIKTIDTRVKEAQTELTRLGCYTAKINGKFDDATKASLVLYHGKKGSLETGERLTDSLLSELKQQNLAVCPPPAAPIVASPGKEELPQETTPPRQKKEQAKREEDARPSHHQQKLETGAKEEEPVSKPSRRHKSQSAALEEEPVAKPPRQRIQRAPQEEEPAPRFHQRAHPAAARERPKAYVAAQKIRRAPSMPMGPAATAGSGSGAAVHGVGF